ncbi:hypothetical protein ACWD38_09000, partial [Saccharopolyspora sp. NPDC002578]
MGALQLVLGLICLAVTAVAVVMVVKTVRRMISSIRLGQPDPTRRGPFGARFGNMLKEVLGHTKMLKWGHVGVAHWFVMPEPERAGGLLRGLRPHLRNPGPELVRPVEPD